MISPPTDALGTGVDFPQPGWTDRVVYLNNTDTECFQYQEDRWIYVAVEFLIENTPTCSLLYQGSISSFRDNSKFGGVETTDLSTYPGADPYWVNTEFPTYWLSGVSTASQTTHPNYPGITFFPITNVFGLSSTCTIGDDNLYLIEESVGLV
jgi:hypothetical protein